MNLWRWKSQQNNVLLSWPPQKGLVCNHKEHFLEFMKYILKPLTQGTKEKVFIHQLSSHWSSVFISPHFWFAHV